MLVSDIKVGIDVAFNNNITKVKKVSYDKALDIQYGFYTQEPYKGALTINCKASHGALDWIIDTIATPYKTGNGKVHKGFYKELEYYWVKVRNDILSLGWDISKGIIVSGKSKGAGEAILLIPYLSDLGKVHICGAIDPPKVCDDKYSEYLDSFGAKMFITSYKNDIVTGIPFWFKHPTQVLQNGKRRLGLSVKDHIKATTEEEIWYEYIKTL